MLFKKKPVIIEAFRFQGEGWLKCATTECTKEYSEGLAKVATFARDADGFPQPHLVIATLEGNMVANLGDWIIRGVKGEFYPCKDEIFSSTYERCYKEFNQ